MHDTGGWVKIHRKLLENPLAEKPSWAWLWVVLLLRANHKDAKVMMNGTEVTLKAGQFITGRNSLASQTKMSATSVERALKYLETVQQIGQQTYSKYRVITILKWKEYQIDGHESGQQADTKRTASGQQTDTNKNDKKEKNDKNDKNESGVNPTPSQLNKSFFERGDEWVAMVSLFTEKGVPKTTLEKEMEKFWVYWTEPNKSGTKQKWEQQNTFDVTRRLWTWLNRSKDYQQKNQPKQRIVL